MTAIIISLQWVEEEKPLKLVICSDSAQAVQSIKSGQTVREDLLMEIYLLLLDLQQLGVHVHVGIEGNEMAHSLKMQ